MRTVATVMGLDDPFEVPKRYSWEQLWLFLSYAKGKAHKQAVCNLHRKAGAKFVTSLGDFLKHVKDKAG